MFSSLYGVADTSVIPTETLKKKKSKLLEPLVQGLHHQEAHDRAWANARPVGEEAFVQCKHAFRSHRLQSTQHTHINAFGTTEEKASTAIRSKCERKERYTHVHTCTHAHTEQVGERERDKQQRTSPPRQEQVQRMVSAP